jgi:hypothetical protein
MDAKAPAYNFLKDRLPKGWSYPLGRSVLDAGLASAGVTSVMFVRYMLYGGSLRGEEYRWPLRVQFDREDAACAASGKVSITVCAVRAAERAATRTELEAKLPVICDWIRRAETAAPTWRMAPHILAIEVSDGQARLVEGPDL